MLPALLLAPVVSLATAAAAAALPVRDAQYGCDGARVSLTVRVDGALGLDRVGYGLNSRDQLWLSIPGGTVAPSTPAFGEAGLEIRAHRQRDALLLTLPLEESWGCRKPVTLEALSDGVRASLSCANPPPPRAAAAAAKAPPASAAATAAARPVVRSVEALAAPPEPNAGAAGGAGSDPGAAPKTADPSTTPALRAGSAQGERSAAASAQGDPSTPGALRAPSAQGERGAEPPLFPSASAHVDAAAGGVSWGGALAVVLLLGLAASAWWLARRRPRVPRAIQILETASLGPRRSLVLARVGSEVLLLGSSEGGLTLLKILTGAEAQGLAVAAAAATAAMGGGLFGRASSPSSPAAADVAAGLARGGAASGQPGFQALLEESVEDQELRRKLERGLSGRIP